MARQELKIDFKCLRKVVAQHLIVSVLYNINLLFSKSLSYLKQGNKPLILIAIESVQVGMNQWRC